MNIDFQIMVPALSSRLGDIRQSRVWLSEEFLGVDKSLDEFLNSINTVNQRLMEIKTAPSPQQTKVAPMPGMSPEDFKIFIERILQGSLEAAGEKLSGKIMNMIGELKGLAGTERDAKLRQIKEAADTNPIDLSTLYTHEAVKSNLGEVGLEEKESKGFESSLDKLRQMRGKPKPGGAPDDKKS